MSTNVIDSEKTAPAAPERQPAKTKGARKSKRAKVAKKSRRATKDAARPKTKRANKKAEVIDLMRRPGGATLAEIMETTAWQAHTVRGFVSILGSKGSEKVESSKNAGGEHTYRVLAGSGSGTMCGLDMSCSADVRLQRPDHAEAGACPERVDHGGSAFRISLSPCGRNCCASSPAL